MTDPSAAPPQPTTAASPATGVAEAGTMEPLQPIRSKLDAPPLMGRAPRPGAVRIRRPLVQAIVLGAGVLLSGALAWAFIVQPDLRERARETAQAAQADDTPGEARPSERVIDQPASYDRLPEPRLPGPFRPVDAGQDPSVRAHAPGKGSDRLSQPPHGPIGAGRSPEPSARALAAASGLFFAGTSAPRADQVEPLAARPMPTRPEPPAGYNPNGLVSPVSPYELKAGSLIPGVLLTAIDTARPGPVVATVSQNVFDSITGRHLVLPQGTRLIGRHEGDSAYGQSRAVLVWDRLILPNGRSLILTGEPGVDARGAVGVPGRTDRRLWSLGIASLFAGAITTLGELARGSQGDDRRSFLGNAGDAASIEAAQVGGRLIDRDLQVRPSIRIAAGAPIGVMITRDLILEPYVR